MHGYAIRSPQPAIVYISAHGNDNMADVRTSKVKAKLAPLRLES